MGLGFAIDDLYGTGWAVSDSSGCIRHADGRSYPGVERVKAEFQAAGFELSVRHIQLFDCYRAEWKDASGTAAGGVVGRCEAEAAVYALAQLRRSLVGVA